MRYAIPMANWGPHCLIRYPILSGRVLHEFRSFIDVKNEKLIAVTRSFQRTPPQKKAYDLTRDQRCLVRHYKSDTCRNVRQYSLISALIVGK